MKIAVLIPCYNEELTIAKVIDDFKQELPMAEVYVYDNNSKDKSVEIVQTKSAILKKEFRQGKGNVVRSMFYDIDADIYIMVDADDTYPANFVKSLIQPVIDNEADMVIGDRLSNGTYSNENKRSFHDFGNNLVKSLINFIFKSSLKDIMTGYRVFNREFVKNIPVLSPGFEIETEMTLHALDKRYRIKEIPIVYRDRPEGSESKLNTFSDGFKVIYTIIKLMRTYKPLLFYGLISGITSLFGLIVGIPVIIEFLETHFITKVPSAILASGFILLSALFLTCGLILEIVVRQFNYIYELLRIKR